MNISIQLLFITLTAQTLCGGRVDAGLTLISEAEAMATVQAREEAKEQAKDQRESELEAAEIIETAIADLGHKKVIFNRVKASPRSEPIETAPQIAEITMPIDHSVSQESTKEAVNLMLSGTVDHDLISEIWWEHEGQGYRIFSNANFLLFSGVGNFEDAEANYSVFSMISGPSTHHISQWEGWRPTTEDFTSGSIEYYLVEWGEADTPDETALSGITTMLQFYAHNHVQMQITYDNSKKIHDAKAAYLEANPPQQRDTIINFAPTGTSAALYE